MTLARTRTRMTLARLAKKGTTLEEAVEAKRQRRGMIDTPETY